MRARWAQRYGNPYPHEIHDFCRSVWHCCSLPIGIPAGLADETTALDAIIVTADRKARTVDETLAPVSIITRADIEKYQASSIADALRRVPGINLSNSGGTGKATSVFIRGTNSNHVLVLIDGIKVGSATTGSVAFEDLPLDQVERIEVVRGPRSSLYGSEALGGVIQIFTRKGGKGFQPEVSVSAGSNNTQKAHVNLAGGDAKTWYNLNAGTETTDGIDATADQREPDADGYERDSLSLRAGRRFANGGSAEVSALRAQGQSQFDRAVNKFRVGATLRAESQRYTDDANTASAKLPGYGTVDLRADYRLAKDWTLGAKLGNVLDKDYQTNAGYNQDGINGLVTVKYAPQ